MLLAAPTGRGRAELFLRHTAFLRSHSAVGELD
jgi:hypothetical protein